MTKAQLEKRVAELEAKEVIKRLPVAVLAPVYPTHPGWGGQRTFPYYEARWEIDTYVCNN